MMVTMADDEKLLILQLVDALKVEMRSCELKGGQDSGHHEYCQKLIDQAMEAVSGRHVDLVAAERALDEQEVRTK